MMTFMAILVVRQFRILESIISLIFEALMVVTVASASPSFMSTRVACAGRQRVIILLLFLKVVRFSHG